MTANGMICGRPRIQTLCGSKKLSRKSWTATDLDSSCTRPRRERAEEREQQAVHPGDDDRREASPGPGT